MTRIAVVGSRRFNDPFKFFVELADEFGPNDELLTGDCPTGVDKMVRDFCREYNHPCSVYLADWNKHGLSAGPRRNANIVDDADRMIAFWDGHSKGTRSALGLATKKGIPIKVVRIDSAC